jgi:hypothetical protein
MFVTSAALGDDAKRSFALVCGDRQDFTSQERKRSEMLSLEMKELEIDKKYIDVTDESLDFSNGWSSGVRILVFEVGNQILFQLLCTGDS